MWREGRKDILFSFGCQDGDMCMLYLSLDMHMFPTEIHCLVSSREVMKAPWGIKKESSFHFTPPPKSLERKKKLRKFMPMALFIALA